jgi:hypothetical protein
MLPVLELRASVRRWDVPWPRAPGAAVSERVTWETCPACGRLAAVGWLDGVPVQFDCPGGCRLPRSRIVSTFSSWRVGTARHLALLRDVPSDPAGRGLVLQAREQAERLLGDMGPRWLHTQGVARRAASVVAVVPDEDRPALVAAAWLHDIGYAEPLNRCAFHPLDGAFFLQETDWGAPVAGLVAHHSAARFVAAVRGLSALMRPFKAEEYAIGPLVDSLTYADQTTGPDGRPMTVDDRLTDMLNRHGPSSPEAQVHTPRAAIIRAAVHRTEQRLTAARTSFEAGHRSTSPVLH